MGIEKSAFGLVVLGGGERRVQMIRIGVDGSFASHAEVVTGAPATIGAVSTDSVSFSG